MQGIGCGKKHRAHCKSLSQAALEPFQETDAMPNPAPSKIEHVFVVMLENRSFDHIFGKSGIPGLTVATSGNSNMHRGVAIPFGGGAPERMTHDPEHEFHTVVEQLCGHGVKFPQGGRYPPINNSGFAANFGDMFDPPAAPGAPEVAAVMQAIDPAEQTPALFELAQEFAVCDAWHASMPGATWPNRFFVHGGSSGGLDHSPTKKDIAIWEAQLGNFKYPNGSIYDRLGKENCRLYQHKTGNVSGKFPQVAALKGVNLRQVHNLDEFEDDLNGLYPYGYTFIEPAYGNLINNSYHGGSSQHPKDGLASGDRLVARVYNAIRQSALWEKSLLIITYDEHGGFYDHVPPPKAVPPGDAYDPRHNVHGFDFSTLGVRVPAVVVSPWISKGRVDHTPYDHSSVVATLCRLFGKLHLTERDRKANDVLGLIGSTLRNDCPDHLEGPLPDLTKALEAFEIEEVPNPAEPVEEGSNLQGFLFVARKAERELGPSPMKDLEAAVVQGPLPETKGAAELYLEMIEAEYVPEADPA
jgi:phospholipase C